jgi:membrane associated rhomboid family serine protease
MPTCYRHPTRETGVACSNCGRPICPDCMTPTPVGMRCPECSRERTRVVRNPTGARADGPTATIVLIAISVLAYIGEMASGGSGVTSAGGSITADGGLWGPYIADGEYWRLVTSGFLHAGFLHLALNMFFIWVLGNMLEPALGRARFVALYFTALLCGSFGVLLLEPEALTVGASGAAFGLLGAAIVIAYRRGVDLWSSGLLPVALFNFAFTFIASNISVGGHVGGFVGGMLVAVLFEAVDRARLPRWAALAGCVALSAIAVAGGIALAQDMTPPARSLF